MSDKDPYIYRIKSVHKVVDGDTIDAVIDLGFDISLTKRIRLAGVDTPESRTSDANEKKYGLESKEGRSILNNLNTNFNSFCLLTRLD